MIHDLMEAYLKSIRRTDPVDFAKLKGIVSKVYMENGWAPPGYFLFFDDILSACVATYFIINPDIIDEDYGYYINGGHQIETLSWSERIQKKCVENLKQPGFQRDSVTIGMHLINGGLLGIQPAINRVIIDKLREFLASFSKSSHYANLERNVLETVREQLAAQKYKAVPERTDPIYRVYHPLSNAAYELVNTTALTPDCCLLDYACLVSYNHLDPRINNLRTLINSCYVFAPFKHICVLVDRPLAYHFNSNGLHRDGGPAFNYGYGFMIWALNGIEVPSFIVESKAENISPGDILMEINVDARREIVRKVGIDRLAKKLGARLLDKSGNYELLLLDFRDRLPHPFLKMRNPSIDAWHIEGVHPDCRTVEQALNWRNGTDKRPVVLT